MRGQRVGGRLAIDSTRGPCSNLKQPGQVRIDICNGSEPWNGLGSRRLDNAYMDAVDRAEQAQFEVLEAEKAMERERPI